MNLGDKLWELIHTPRYTGSDCPLCGEKIWTGQEIRYPKIGTEHSTDLCHRECIEQKKRVREDQYLVRTEYVVSADSERDARRILENSISFSDSRTANILQRSTEVYPLKPEFEEVGEE